MPSEGEIRATIVSLIRDSHRKIYEAGKDPKFEGLTEEDLRQKAAEEEPTSTTQAPYLRVVRETPFQDELERFEGLEQLAQERVQLGLRFREFLVRLGSGENIDRVMADFGLYQPSRRQKAWWTVVDRFQAVGNRLARIATAIK